MFLDSESAWIDIKGQLSEGHSPSRKLLPGSANRKNEDLSDNVADCEGRLKSVSIYRAFPAGKQTYRRPKN